MDAPFNGAGLHRGKTGAKKGGFGERMAEIARLRRQPAAVFPLVKRGSHARRLGSRHATQRAVLCRASLAVCHESGLLRRPSALRALLPAGHDVTCGVMLGRGERLAFTLSCRVEARGQTGVETYRKHAAGVMATRRLQDGCGPFTVKRGPGRQTIQGVCSNGYR